MLKISDLYSTWKKKSIMHQVNVKNDGNFDIVELEICRFCKHFAYVPCRMNGKLQILQTWKHMLNFRKTEVIVMQITIS